MALSKNEETKQETSSQPSGGTKRGRKKGSKNNQKKKRYWSRRPIAEQLLKKAVPALAGGGITVYFISSAKPHIPS